MDTFGEYRERLRILEKRRDEINKKIEPLRLKREELNKRAAALTEEAVAVSIEMDRMRGGAEHWLDLKRHICALYRLLGKNHHVNG